MRWIFITLVFGNLLLLAYFWQEQNRLAPIVASSVELPRGGKTLQLVKELDYALPSITKVKREEKRTPLCYVAGPYSEIASADNLLVRAKSLSFSGKVNVIEVVGNEPSEYWVFVPPRMSREAAMRTLRELQQQKIDSYVITQGDLAEGISIGLFRNKESAYGLQERISSMSIPAEVKVINKNTNEYWVEINETTQLNEALRLRIQAADEGVSWELVECSPVSALEE